MESLVQSRGDFLVGSILGPGGKPPEARPCYKQANSQHQGDLFFSRATTDSVLKRLGEQDGGDVKDSSIFEFSSPDIKKYFTKAFINPQGQLCLRLHRPSIFAESLMQVEKEGPKYGHTHHSSEEVCSTVPNQMSVLLVNDTFSLKNIDPLSSGSSSCEKGCGMTVSEGRSLLLMGVLANLLRGTGVKVYHNQGSLPSFSSMSGDDPVRLFLEHYFTNKDQEQLQGTEHDITSFLSELHPPSAGTMNLPDSGRQVKSKPGGEKLRAEANVDAEKFLRESELTGRSGYDSNIKNIPVFNEDGSRLHPASLLAHEVWRASAGSHVTCHVAPPSKSFLVQQAMILHEMKNRTSVSARLPHLCMLLSGDVECVQRGGGGGQGGRRGLSEGGGAWTKPELTLTELLSIRGAQMRAVYSIKYGDTAAQSGQLLKMSQRMAEAVVKFEFLSHDAHTKVKLELPSSGSLQPASGCPENEPRFSGSFVLYNYARMASVLSRHKQLSGKGAYPPLPPVDEVDFSLLTDEVEWQLLFQFVLRFSVVARESAELRGRGGKVGGGGGASLPACVVARLRGGGGGGATPPTTQVAANVKKLCLFLVSWSRMFSAYYSRVKILMSPEPHLLPVIHARLHLLGALYQVVSNALCLLGIEPLDHL